MKKNVFRPTQLVCFVQDDSEIDGSASLTGVLTKTDDCFRFEQEVNKKKPRVYNPKIFDEKYVSLVRRHDNSLKFFFKDMPRNLDPVQYASDVSAEIINALKQIE